MAILGIAHSSWHWGYHIPFDQQSGFGGPEDLQGSPSACACWEIHVHRWRKVITLISSMLDTGGKYTAPLLHLFDLCCLFTGLQYPVSVLYLHQLVTPETGTQSDHKYRGEFHYQRTCMLFRVKSYNIGTVHISRLREPPIFLLCIVPSKAGPSIFDHDPSRDEFLWGSTYKYLYKYHIYVYIYIYIHILYIYTVY